MTNSKDLSIDYDADFLDKIGFISEQAIFGGGGSDKPVATARELAETVHSTVGEIGQAQKLAQRMVQQKNFELTYR